jgi:hypothetical protein
MTMDDVERSLQTPHEKITLRESVYHAASTPEGYEYVYTEYYSDGKRAIKAEVLRRVSSGRSHACAYFARVDDLENDDEVQWSPLELSSLHATAWHPHVQASSQYCAPVYVTCLTASMMRDALHMLCWDD